MADPLTYREVTGLWTVRVPDGPDTDAYPDTVPLVGRVVFTPDYRKPLVYPGEHVIVEPINAVLVDGVLMAESLDGDNVVLGPLFLPVTVDELADQTWAWEMSFHDLRLGEYGEEVTLPKVRFQIPEGAGPIDLSAVAPASSSGGVITLRGPRGYGVTGITADSGVVTVEWEGGDDVQIPIPTAALATPTSDGLMAAADKAKLDAVPNPSTITTESDLSDALGDLVRIDTTAGNRIFVSDVMVAGETGRRNMAGSLLAEWRVGGSGISLSRSNDLVTASIDVVRTANGGTFANILDLPAGFVPATSGRIAPAFISITVQGWLDNMAKTVLRVRDLSGGLTDGDRLIATVMWTTRDPWPTTLPGTPA